MINEKNVGANRSPAPVGRRPHLIEVCRRNARLTGPLDYASCIHAIDPSSVIGVNSQANAIRWSERRDGERLRLGFPQWSRPRFCGKLLATRRNRWLASATHCYEWRCQTL